MKQVLLIITPKFVGTNTPLPPGSTGPARNPNRHQHLVTSSSKNSKVGNKNSYKSDGTTKRNPKTKKKYNAFIRKFHSKVPFISLSCNKIFIFPLLHCAFCRPGQLKQRVRGHINING